MLHALVQGQGKFTDRYWPLGDRAALNFSNIQNPVGDTSVVYNRISNEVSLCDSSGNLILYSATNITVHPIYYDRNVNIYNNQHQLIKNGANLYGKTISICSKVFVPDPDNDSLIYYFTAFGHSTSGPYWIYYSIINLYQDNGKPEVIAKNILLSNNSYGAVTAIKHGNGKDWWLICFKDSVLVNNDCKFYAFLINSNGINSPVISHINIQIFYGPPYLSASQNGNKISLCGANSELYLFDFDRCSGQTSNMKKIGQISWPYLRIYDACEFSASGRYLYTIETTIVSSPSPSQNQIYQYDTWASNIFQSEVKLDSISFPVNDERVFLDYGIKRGPDDKIYISPYYYIDTCTFNNLLYCSSFHNAYSDSLIVINSPDSAGAACNIVRHGQYISNTGGRSASGLPNNPNYELGPLIGSPCDTLSVSVAEYAGHEFNFSLSPNPAKGTIEIIYQLPQNKSGMFELYDLTGKKVFTYNLPPWSTLQHFDLSFLSNGMYHAVITSDGFTKAEKLVLLRP